MTPDRKVPRAAVPGTGACDGAHSSVVEPRPAGAERLLGNRVDAAERLVHHLVTSGVERGLLGPREVERIWSRHLLNCLAVAELVPCGATVADVGSGAGLPGLVLAVARPDLKLTLVEPMDRRCSWLREVAADLGVVVEVRRSRAEDLAGTLDVDVVTARAVARLDALARWCLPLLRTGGELLALKGRTAADELEAARPALLRSGAVSIEILQCGTGVLRDPTTVVRVRVGRRRETRRPPRSRRGRPQ